MQMTLKTIGFFGEFLESLPRKKEIYRFLTTQQRKRNLWRKPFQNVANIFNTYACSSISSPKNV